MITSQLKPYLHPVAERRRRWRLGLALGICWASAAVLGGLLLALHRSTGWASALTMPLLALGAAIGALFIRRRLAAREPDWLALAREIEQEHPDLQALLLTALEQQPDARTGELNFLQDRVIKEAVLKAVGQQWSEAISGRRLAFLRLAHWTAFASLVFCLLQLHFAGARASLSRPADGVEVTPGDALVESGDGLVVLARFHGKMPAEAKLVIGQSADSAKQVIPLTKNLSDPVFGGGIPEIRSNFVYHVAFGRESTRDYKVRVFEFPRLERADFDITYPAYTGLAEKRIEQTRRVSAVEGSRFDLALQLNKPVVSAKLIGKDKSIISLTANPAAAGAVLTQYVLTNSQTYQLQLVDAEGRTNKVSSQFVFEAMTNKTPALQLTSPRGDTRVSAIEEIAFSGQVSDDFGLLGYGLGYTIAGKETKYVTLGQTGGRNEKRALNHLLPLENLGMRPGQLISYFLWAEDYGPDGRKRRAPGDLFFVEVRPFDEIFRQGEASSPSGSPESEEQNQSPSTKLAELQKQIIQATWKLQNQEKDRSPSPQYLKDAPVVRQSQKQALEQARAAKEKATNPQAQAGWSTVEQEMDKAVTQLDKATKSTEPLPAALDAEQSAYQALLKLQAHEYQVSKSRAQSSGRANSEQTQRQIDQLDMKFAEDRYETQSEAAKPQNSQQKEQLQTLNRLKELARRQQDLNEQLKDIQTALHEAKTEAEREELRRRLKRLREEEQQMLADVDALQQRMENSSDPSRTADARQELERTRAEVRRAEAAMQEQTLSQALTSGTRVQRDLQKLTEDFRQQSASQFAEEMRDLRTSARELAQKEKEIADKLQAMTEAKRKTLTDSEARNETAAQLNQQKRAVTNLLDKATQISEKAETSEPILSRKLYDTLRQSQQQRLDNTLEMTSAMLRNSYLPQASQLEKRARQGIEDLKTGIEGAADSVLGDETEALRQARKELDNLARQVENEMGAARSNSLARMLDKAALGETNLLGMGNSRAGMTNTATGGTNRTGGLSGRSPRNTPGERGTNDATQLASSGSPGADRQGAGGQEQAGRDQQAGRSQNQPGRGQQGAPGQNQPGEDQQAANGQPDPAGQGQQPGRGQGQAGRGQQPSPGQNQPGADPQQAANGQGQPGEDQQAANGQPDQPGQGQQPGRGQGQGQGQPGEGQPGNRGGNRRLAQMGNRRGGPAPNPNAPANTPRPGGPRQPSSADPAGLDPAARQGDGSATGPITGAEYTQWSERLRDVQDMLDFPDLRTEVARVRENAQAMRVEYKQRRTPPQWDLMQTQILKPLAEVRHRIDEELARRESKEPLVPLDRDPVPNRYSELVRRYYEQLGRDR